MSDLAEQVEIRLLNGDAEADAAAHLMADTDPWITLGRKFEHTRKAVTHPAFEVYVAVAGQKVIGVLILAIAVPLIRGYIASLAIDKDHRKRGIGRRMLAFAEQRIGRESPNVFLCVSSFNTEARKFYERQGFQQVGELPDFLIPGHSEILMLKSKGPWSTFRPA